MPCLLNDKLFALDGAQRRLVRRSVERRNLDCLCQLLGSLGGGECLDDGAELVAQKDAVVGGVEADTVIMNEKELKEYK